MKLECARNESTINAMDAEDFPRIQEIKDGISLQLDPKALRAPSTASNSPPPATTPAPF